MNHVVPMGPAMAETARLAALDACAVLDTPPEPGFDALAALAAHATGCPMAYVALLDATRQWLKAAHGIDPALLSCPRHLAFCDETIRGDDVLVVPDLAASPRHAGHPAVTGPPHLRFYAGAPLLNPDGHALGTLCVVDTVPRSLDPAAIQALRSLAGRVVTELELRRRLLELEAARASVLRSEAGLREAHERLDIDFRGVLDGVADGVLTVAADGRIMALNAAGAAILGCDLQTAEAATLQALLPDDGGGDAFLDAVLAPVADPDAPPAGRQVVTLSLPGSLPGSPPGSQRRVDVNSRATRLRMGPDRGRLAVTVTFSDVTELERLAGAEAQLNAELREQHGKLQSAFLQLERSAERIRSTTRRLQAVRIAAALGVVLLFAGVGLYVWGPGLDLGRATGADLPGMGTLTAVAEPISLRIAVVGVLDAGDMVGVVAPFDGLVAARMFQYGGQVERGAPLLRLDVAEVEVRLRDARSAQIKARQKVDELRGWTTGGEVSRARRTLAAAEMEAADIRTRVGQSQMLLARGIIPAEELRNLQQQQRNQALQVQAARQDLEATLGRGDAGNLRIAQLELDNADVKVRDLEADLGNAAVAAPVTGVVLLPPEPAGGRRAETIEVGSRVTRGQSMFTLGNLESFIVRASVDEIDVGRVRVGQAVAVTGDAFAGQEMTGRVSAVAAQATAGGLGRSGMPTFAVTVAVSGLDAEQRQRLAVGMSANLSIIAYENAEAIVLPPGAIHSEGTERVVRVRDGLTTRTVPVQLGISTPAGVEIRSGLKPGDAVLLGG